MAYRFRLYAPTDGVRFVDLYYDGDYVMSCFPEGNSTPCWDDPNCEAGTVMAEAVLEDGYRTTAWVVNLDGTSYQRPTDEDSYNYQVPDGTTSLAFRIEVEQLTMYYASLYFDANGGKDPPEAIEDNWTTNDDQLVNFDIPEDEPTREGYAFGGWAEYDDGSGGIWYPGDAYGNYGSEEGEKYTLYAVWIKTGGGINVDPGRGMETGTMYVWDNGEWVKGTVYVWDSGEWKKGV